MQDIAYKSPYDRFKHPLVGREGTPYYADAGLLAAANAALALERPLLLTGEPGCGKTEFAFAAASGLSGAPEQPEYRPLEFYVRSGTTATDLLYRYDAVRRFSDAQSERSKARAELPQNYVVLEALGNALISPTRRVVLIDEIDKAQRDLPNDLLRELDQGDFEIPEIDFDSAARAAEAESGHQHLSRLMSRGEGVEKPLVIITSNVERQLPEAFLRRCLFHYVPFPSDKQLIEILESRAAQASDEAEAAEESKPHHERHKRAVKIFGALRHEQSLSKRPATAELIDWVGCLRSVFASGPVDHVLEVQAERAADSKPIEWAALPGLSCLVKLREDLEALGVAAN